MSTKILQIVDGFNIKEAQNADTLDGKHASDFALAEDIENLQTQIDNIDTSEGVTKDNIISALGYTPLNSSLKGANNGVAELDANGKVPSSQLPSYIDDVVEYTAKANFPTTGETGKIYVDRTTNLTYRWTGSIYVEISPSIALGETSATAYRGDRGKIAYDHSQSAHNYLPLTGGTVSGNVTATKFIGGLTGNADTATTATKLGTANKGSATQPIYLNAGTPTATTYTLGKSVPSDAVFTDTNVTVYDKNPTSGTWYYPTWKASTSGTGGLNANDGFRYYSSQGTASTSGQTVLSIGNATASGTAGNKYGQLRLYSESSGYGILIQEITNEGLYHCLPNTSGTILNTGTTSFTQTLTSGTQIGTIKIDGTETKIYAPTNTDTHYTSKNVVGSSTATSNTTSALTNGNVYLNSVENGTVTSSHKISGSGATTVTTDASGNIVISSTDTNTNTDTKATQTNTTTSADYRVVLSTNANDTTETNTLRKSTNFTANPSTGAFYAKGYDRIDITGQTLDVNTLTLSAGSPEIMRYIVKTSGGASNITNIPVAGSSFILDVELIRWASASDYITKQTFVSVNAKSNEYVRYCTSGTWDTSWTKRVFTDNNTTYSAATSSALGLVKIGSNITNSSGTISLTKGNVTAALGYTPPTTNTTYSAMTGATSSAAGTSGLVPAPAAGKQTSFLRGDGTWVVPTNTTYSNFVKSGSGAAAGLVPAPSTTAGTTKYLREDGTWQVPPNTNTTYSAGTGISLSGTTFSNSGVRSISSGSANGTISVNTNGTSANVAVKGLGSAAYTDSTAYVGVNSGIIPGGLTTKGGFGVSGTLTASSISSSSINGSEYITGTKSITLNSATSAYTTTSLSPTDLGFTPTVNTRVIASIRVSNMSPSPYRYCLVPLVFSNTLYFVMSPATGSIPAGTYYIDYLIAKKN